MTDELIHTMDYSATVAFRDAVSSSSADWAPYTPVSDWLEQLLPPIDASQLPEFVGATKTDALAELQF